MSEINYDEISEAPVKVSDDELQTIADLAHKQILLEEWINKQEEKVNEAKKKLAKLSGEDLPEALRAAGVKEFTLANGLELKLNTDIKANITKANQEWCWAWLKEHGHGDLIRNEFKVSYGVGEQDDAEEMVEFLAANHQDFNQKEFIHHSTLPAFVRRELDENDHDEEWEKRFGVYRHTYVNIVRPKG
jgi:hypothetical protein